MTWSAASAAESPRDAGWQAAAILGVVMIAGAVLRFRGLGDDSLWWDEGATWQQVNGSLGEVISRTALDTYPPGFNVLAWAALRLFGPSEWSLRLPSAICGVLQIPAAYWLASMVAGRTAGIFAAMLFCFNSYAVYYSQEARGYALLMLAATLFAGATLRLLVRPSVAMTIGLGIAGAALLYSHPYGGLAWVSVDAALLVLLAVHPPARPAFWYLAAGQLLALLAFAPWVPVLLRVSQTLARDGFWESRPTIMSLPRGIKEIVGGSLPALLTAVFGAALLVRWRRPSPPLLGSGPDVPAAFALPVLGALAVGPVALGFIISMVSTPIFLPRYLLVVLPAIVVLAAWGASRLASDWRRFAAVLLATGLVMASTFFIAPKLRHEDWRGLAAELKFSMTPADCVAAIDPNKLTALEYYMAAVPLCSPDELARRIDPAGSEPGRLFVIQFYAEPIDDVVDRLGAGPWRRRSRSFGPELKLLVFERASAAPPA